MLTDHWNIEMCTHGPLEHGGFPQEYALRCICGLFLLRPLLLLRLRIRLPREVDLAGIRVAGEIVEDEMFVLFLVYDTVLHAELGVADGTLDGLALAFWVDASLAHRTVRCPGLHQSFLQPLLHTCPAEMGFHASTHDEGGIATNARPSPLSRCQRNRGFSNATTVMAACAVTPPEVATILAYRKIDRCARATGCACNATPFHASYLTLNDFITCFCSTTIEELALLQHLILKMISYSFPDVYVRHKDIDIGRNTKT